MNCNYAEMQVKMRAQEYYKTTLLSAFGPLTNVVVILLDLTPYSLHLRDTCESASRQKTL